MELSAAGARRPSPLSDFSWFWQQSCLPDPQKKKKKKWREADYFYDLHTLEPLDQEQEAAQQALLEEVRLQGLLCPNPSPEEDPSQVTK